VSQSNYRRKLDDFCLDGIDGPQKAILDHISDADVKPGCANVYPVMLRSPDPQALVDRLAPEVDGIAYDLDPDQNLRFNRERLGAGFAGFKQAVPTLLTEKLAYRPSSRDPLTMFTSTFAHASWEHLLGNLFFFFAFACGLECLLGWAAFVASFVAMVVIPNLVYSHVAATTGDLPTIGLSGVAMGMMAMAAVIAPTGRIRFFVFSLYLIRTLSLPVLQVALGFVALNLVEFWIQADAHVNYVIHFAGAATGAVLGLCFRLFAPGRMLTLANAKGAR
jgi:membrane associated rhomboid family serine protease